MNRVNLQNQARLQPRLQLHGAEQIAGWLLLAQERQWDALVEQLLMEHYDPAYRRSTVSHYPTLDRAPVVFADRIDAQALSVMAHNILQITTLGSATPAIAA